MRPFDLLRAVALVVWAAISALRPMIARLSKVLTPLRAVGDA